MVLDNLAELRDLNLQYILRISLNFQYGLFEANSGQKR